MLAAFGLGCASASAGVLLGCIVPDVKSVSEFGPLLFVPQLLFSGFFIRTSLIPVFLRWAQYLCALKYALDIVLLTEFNTNLPSCQGDAYNNCKGVLTNNNIEQGLWWLYMILLIALTVVFRSLATYVLVQKSKKFY